MNSAFEMYDFIIGWLLQSEMTSRQSTLFRFVTRALFALPAGTIHTFHDILANGPKNYQAHIDTLDDTFRQFFRQRFQQSAIQTDERAGHCATVGRARQPDFYTHVFEPAIEDRFLFRDQHARKSHPRQCRKGVSKEEGTELFGRFFLALINQAATQRSSLPTDMRLPCFVYVDECHNYIRNDAKIEGILAEARQQNIGVVLAHQYLGQIEAPVLRALAANTSIKMAARLEGADRSAMARDMNTAPDFIRDQKIGSFATFVRDRPRRIATSRDRTRQQKDCRRAKISVSAHIST